MRFTTALTRYAMAKPRGAAQTRWMLRWGLVALLSAATVATMLPAPALAQSTAVAARSSNGGVGAPNYLKVGTLVEFDTRRIRNVGDAMKFLLEPVSYQITNRTVDQMVSNAILRRPIPPAAINAGVMSIESALLLLIGDDNRLVVDHVNRLVAVERMPGE